jgi:aspartyl-tRNA(Asn)/glutamyl-tRNA(Gln) amidotransferase subunit A
MVTAADQGVAKGDLTGTRVGVVRQLQNEGVALGVAKRFDEALGLMARNGAEIIEIDTPHLEYAVAAYYLILPAEASSNLAKFDSVRFGLRVTPAGNPTVEDVMSHTRDKGFGDEVKRRIILGTYALSAGYYDAYYGKAQRVRTLIQEDFRAAFEQADVLVSPSAPTTAFALGAKLDDPLAMWAGDLTTIPANLAGIPGMSLPMGLAPDDGLPVGLQLMAPAYEDHRLYTVGAMMEALFLARDGSLVSQQTPEVN